MSVTRVCKADSLGSDPVPDAHIAIENILPTFDSIRDAEAFYLEQATAIVDVLGTLPQGTRYAVLRILLERAHVFYRGM